MFHSNLERRGAWLAALAGVLLASIPTADARVSAVRPQRTARPAAPALPTDVQVVAVLDPVGVDVAPAVLDEIEASLLEEVQSLSGTRALTHRDVQRELRPRRIDPARCLGDVACLARAGRLAGAHRVLETRLVQLGDSLSASIALIDTQSGRELDRVADPLSDQARLRTTEIHRAVVQLLEPSTYVGSLTVQCNVAGASVYVDDALVGTTPLDTLPALRAGPHRLRVSKAGHRDLHRFVDVTYRRATTVEVDLHRGAILSQSVDVVAPTGTGSLYVVSAEAGLWVRVDGEPIAPTRFTAPIDAGAGVRTISIRKPGLPPVTRKVVIEPGRRTQLDVTTGPRGLVLAVLGTVDDEAPLPRPRRR